MRLNHPTVETLVKLSNLDRANLTGRTASHPKSNEEPCYFLQADLRVMPCNTQFVIYIIKEEKRHFLYFMWVLNLLIITCEHYIQTTNK
jgi:hypothetical protein